MIRSTIAVVMLATTLAGCQTGQQQGEARNVFYRVDGKRIATNPKILQQAELDKTICIGEVQKISAGAAPVYYQGLIGAIGAGIIVDQKQKALVDVYDGCMATKGYRRGTRSEAEANTRA